MEPELLVPISFAAPAGDGPHARPTAVVLAGDHCQLGPAVRSAAAAPLEKSLMERLVCLGTLERSPGALCLLVRVILVYSLQPFAT